LSSLARATAVMSLGTVVSRATGLLRIAAIAAALGVVESDRLTDAYNYANTAPNIIYELVLGGVLTSVFVPVFVELLEKEGRERAWEVASAIINLSMVILVAITAIGIIAAPWIARIYSTRLEGAEAAQQLEVITFLLRLLIPQIIFYALTALTAGLLNAHKRFGAPMYTPILNNLAVIAVFVAFHQSVGAVTEDSVTRTQLLVIGLGTTAGVAIMAVAQLPFLKGLGRYRLTFSISHPSVRKLARLSLFVIGYVVANQIGYIVVQILASEDRGAYTAYIWAFTFFMLPHGLFAVSLITALLPGMSEHAVNARWNEFRDRLSTGVRATFLLVLPAAVGYFVLGEPIVRFLLKRGVMTETSVDLVAGVLQFFVIGLVPFSIFQLFLRAFYAMQDTKTPFMINCGAVALNTAVNIPMFAILGVRGLAAGHALAYTFGAGIQGAALRGRIGGIDGRRILESLARIGAAAAGMGFVVWGVSTITERLVAPEGFLQQTIGVVVPVALGVAAYLLLARALRVEELDLARGLIRRRLVPKDD
jgi:putative peptidoglycan lipid II flippase